ncbi:MAG: DegT/DnrJ/EryC1/StrS family aminotransferase [Dysgonamonadaceae bacterium]|jgi:dTDP-4-amino-4,6-dideoxygalactose transaminase|nr:DegT/DnrJ/EryC1/StrS family aminotransferase [Dysgonamonadaceae bacterium]
MEPIKSVDLTSQYLRLKTEIDEAVAEVIRSGNYINGQAVSDFAAALAAFSGSRFAIPCGNGTDALQLSLMALDLQPGSEVIVPDFTYIAAAEAVALLRLVPVLVDVDPKTFNLAPEKLANALSSKTKAVIPVHLFGQSCDMAPILKIARENNLYVIEDNAQSIGTEYVFPDGSRRQTGTMGLIGAFSFFPTKNLGCFGDGGAMTTDSEELAERLRKLTVHGQSKKYVHEKVGVNSRLDTLQAAILKVKLAHLQSFTEARRRVAAAYDQGLQSRVDILELPYRHPASTHVFNQYVIKVKNDRRDDLQKYLTSKGVPATVYYPLPMHRQPALCGIFKTGSDLTESEKLCRSVLALPIHTEMSEEQINYIIKQIIDYE